MDEYVRMRQESLHEGATFGFTSARTLLAILRLSQALARLSVPRRSIARTLSSTAINDALAEQCHRGGAWRV